MSLLARMDNPDDVNESLMFLAFLFSPSVSLVGAGGSATGYIEKHSRGANQQRQ